MKLSIVTTMYYSAPYIVEFHERITKVAKQITEDYEIIFVNDGSPDNSLDVAIDLYNKNEKIKIVDLSRNFGHHKAIMTGLSEASGEYIFLIDLDLEEEPELLSLFWEEFNNKMPDVVFGVQESRKGSLFEKFSGWLYYLIFNFMSNVKLPRNLITARLMSSQYVKSLLLYRDQELMLAGLMVLTGFRQISLRVKKHSLSPSTYNFSKKISLMVNSLVAFSNKPLVLIFNAGAIITSISFIWIFVILLRKLILDISIGWTSIIVSIWFLGGLTIFSLGVIGIYLSKIFIEVKNRPYTITRKIYEK